MGTDATPSLTHHCISDGDSHAISHLRVSCEVGQRWPLTPPPPSLTKREPTFEPAVINE